MRKVMILSTQQIEKPYRIRLLIFRLFFIDEKELHILKKPSKWTSMKQSQEDADTLRCCLVRWHDLD